MKSNVIEFRKAPRSPDDQCCMCGERATTTLNLVDLDAQIDVTKFFCSEHAPRSSQETESHD